jgi:putative FmdB family regulatory protein
MPTYEYRCDRCGRGFAKRMTLGQHARRPDARCPKCGSRKVRQMPSSFQVVTSKKS